MSNSILTNQPHDHTATLTARASFQVGSLWRQEKSQLPKLSLCCYWAQSSTWAQSWRLGKVWQCLQNTSKRCISSTVLPRKSSCIVALEYIIWPLCHFTRDDALHSSQSSPLRVFFFCFHFFLHLLSHWFFCFSPHQGPCFQGLVGTFSR